MIPHELIHILAELYPRTKEIERVAGEAGVGLHHIDLHGSALDVWHHLLRWSAHHDGMLGALIDATAGEFPRRADEIRRWGHRALAEPITGSHGPATFEGPGGRPALPVPYFHGHELEMATLEALLSDPDAPACVVVSGLGGVGKSSLVQHFVATRAQRLFADGAVWLDAKVGPFDLELDRAAHRFGHRARAPAYGNTDPSIWLTIRLNNRRVLLVIDDADLLRVNHRQLLVPGGGCRTVIITQLNTLHTFLNVAAAPLRVHPWSLEGSRAYLRATVPGLVASDAALDPLADFAAGLPLALCLIAHHLQLPGKRVTQLYEQLHKRSIGKLDEMGKGAVTGVATTFAAAFDELGERDRQVLVALAWCAPATRTEVVARVAGVAADDADQVEDALDDLASRSLATYTEDAERPWGMHALLRRFVRDRPGSDEAREAHIRFAFDCARSPESTGGIADLVLDRVEVWSAFRRLFVGDAASKTRADKLIATLYAYLLCLPNDNPLLPRPSDLISVIRDKPAELQSMLEAIQRFIADAPGRIDPGGEDGALAAGPYGLASIPPSSDKPSSDNNK